MTPKEARAEWVKALRSGKYKQAEGQLRYRSITGGHKYCCLGVACDVYSKKVRHRDLWDVNSFLNRETELPEVVREWLGLAHGCASFKEAKRRWVGAREFKIFSLISANDEAHWDFNKIADAIENDELEVTDEAE